MLATIRAKLATSFPPTLVDELLAAFDEAKRNYYLGGARLAEVEGGRFCEAAFRMLESATTGKFTPLGKQLPRVDVMVQRLEQLPGASSPDAIRLHIPRTLRVVYDIRNKRDAAHLGDGIDPNLQDSTLAVSVLDWVLAEFIRLYHPGMTPDDAQGIVQDIVTRICPVVQEFDGFLKVLNPNLSAGHHCLVLLYQRGAAGATLEQLREWVRPAMRRNLRQTLSRLVNDKAFVHDDGQRYVITRAGQQETEARHLLDP
jgi:hypothetical protein